jgi:apolipoprotein N-acyltransferase
MYLDRPDSPVKKFLAGAAWGAIMSLGLAYWLAYAMIWQYGTSVATSILFMIFGLMLPHALVYGIFAVMYVYLKENYPFRGSGLIFHLLVVPSLWVVTEFSRELIPLLVPWGYAGYALQPWNLIMQMADITGIYGISFIVVMINAAIACIARDIDLDEPWRTVLRPITIAGIRAFIIQNRVPLLIMLMALLIPLLYGAVRRHDVRHSVERERAAGKGISTTVVQPNFTQEERWSGNGFIERVNVCLGLSRRCAPAGAGADAGRDKTAGPGTGDREKSAGEGSADRAGAGGLVVWPETVLNSQGMVNIRLFKFIRSCIGDVRLIVAGGVRRAIGKNGLYNAAYLVTGRDGVTYYDKNILLPYAETAPLGGFLGDFYTAPAEFLPGDTPPAAETDIGIAGLSICFESMYSWHVRQSVRKGARFLVNISNDGWFGRTSEPVLHVRQASVRAIENRRFLVRSSNNGISAIITPDGEMAARSGLFTTECLAGEIVTLDSKTIYGLLGDWIIYAAVLVLMAMLVAALVKK